MTKLAVVSGASLPSPPYPEDILSRGWVFDLDMERIEQSDTWSLCPAEIRPWLLMLWARSWLNAPCGTFSANEDVIAARIGMPPNLFRAHRDVLMRGWERHSDGRLYHPTVTESVMRMIGKRAKDAARMAAYRNAKNQALESNVTRDSRVSSPEVRHPHPLPHPTTTSLREVVAGKPAPSVCPHQKILALYREVLPEFPDLHGWGGQRERNLQARWREEWVASKWQSEEDGLKFWRAYFQLVRRSKFLMGQVKAWQATIDWLVKRENYLKVCEGKYER